MIFHLFVVSVVILLEVEKMDNEWNNKEEKEEERIEELLIQFLYRFVLLKLYIISIIILIHFFEVKMVDHFSR